MSCLLEAKGVSFSYERDAPVLENVDASVREGALIGIVGPNGSGKSTLLRLLCGLLTPGAGSIHLDQRPLRSLRGRQRARQIAFLPQSVSPAFSLTVFEVVCLGRYPHTNALGALGPGDLAAAEDALRETHCEKLRHRDFSSLSGGERQRVLLASILAQEPQFLLLDEPTSALDIHHQVEVLSLLRALSGQGYGIAMVTHDLNLAARFCHEIVLLGHDHHIAASGAPDDVLTGLLLSKAYGASIRVAPHPFLPVPLIMAESPGVQTP